MPYGKKYGGRVKGTPNKATADARQAIAQFVDGNAHRLTEWLDSVAEGVKTQEQDPETGEMVEKWVVPPNPAKAFDLFQSVVEYHVPKLARMEHVGDPENPMQVEHYHDVFGELLKNLKMQRQSE